MSELRRQSEHNSHIGQVKSETMDRGDCMRMQIVMERRETMNMEMVIDKKDSLKMEMVMNNRERMKGLELGVTHRRHKDHELCFMDTTFRLQ